MNVCTYPIFVPVVPAAFLPPNLTFQLPAGFLYYSLTVLFDVFRSLYHPFICKGMFPGANSAISNILREIFGNTEDA